MMSFILISLLFAGFSQGRPGFSTTTRDIDQGNATQYLSNARDGLTTLQQWYSDYTGRWRSTGWWNSANCLQVVADLRNIDPSLDAITNPIFETTYLKAQQPWFRKRSISFSWWPSTSATHRFLNNYYDDESWWAEAFITVYDITKDTKYLQVGEGIFKDVRDTAGGAPCGGVWQRRDRFGQTSISNSLALLVAASLARRTTGDDQQGYSDWAVAQADFILGSGLINGENLVVDGFISDSPPCALDTDHIYTYNQGVLIGALVEMKLLTNDDKYINRASDIAHAVVTKLTNENGILIEPIPQIDSKDGTQFKGIFARNLMLLHNQSPRDEYLEFFAKNAQSIWNVKDDSGRFGLDWEQSSPKVDASTHSSALMAIVGAAGVNAPLAKS